MAAKAYLVPMPTSHDYGLTQEEADALHQIYVQEIGHKIDETVLKSLQDKGMLEGMKTTEKGREASSYWQPKPFWDYSEDGKVWKSCAVIASDGDGNDVLLHAMGPAIDWHIDQYGTNCEELGLSGYTEPGIWVFEGTMGAVRLVSIDYGEDWDLEVSGDWREPTPEEWESIKSGDCPWDKDNLPRWEKK